MAKAGRPKVWTKKRIAALADLLDRFLKKDPLFEDMVFGEIAEAVPTIAHFLATLHVKWDEIREEYPALSGVKKAPGKPTVINLEELTDYIQAIKVIQERGLIYGGLSGQLSGSIATLMLQDHGYIKKNANEISGPEGGAVTVRIIDDI